MANQAFEDYFYDKRPTSTNIETKYIEETLGKWNYDNYVSSKMRLDTWYNPSMDGYIKVKPEVKPEVKTRLCRKDFVHNPFNDSYYFKALPLYKDIWDYFLLKFYEEEDMWEVSISIKDIGEQVFYFDDQIQLNQWLDAMIINESRRVVSPRKNKTEDKIDEKIRNYEADILNTAVSLTEIDSDLD